MTCLRCDRRAIARGLCPSCYDKARTAGTLPPKLRVGRRVDTEGYVHVWAPGHPIANRDGYVLEHRKVVHDAGIEMPPGHHVHHLNGDKRDNRPENLEVLGGSEHSYRHVHEAGFVSNQSGRWPLRPTPEARLADRIERLGHGHRNTYLAGCHCGSCREANNAYLRAWKQRSA